VESAATSRIAAAVERPPHRRGIGASARPVALHTFLEGRQPDLLVFSPLIALGSTQFDLLHAAQRLGIPTALAVGSWDHLSSKTLDTNGAGSSAGSGTKCSGGRRRSTTGIAPDRVMVTGAQCFDVWFDRRPSLDRDAFCEQVGLPGGQPYVLYVCSVLLREISRVRPHEDRSRRAAWRAATHANLQSSGPQTASDGSFNNAEQT